ncbi:MAG TPA: hypothetical protein VEY94_13970, partial [Patescibacteria group bacterium]|nr:hypothetical protein [Patescibacteria group bacterium]
SPGPLKSPVENDVVKRAEPRPAPAPAPEVRARSAQPAVAERREFVQQASPDVQERAPAPEPQAQPSQVRNEADNDPLNRSFGDREQKTDTSENLKFVFSDHRNEVIDPPPEHELERPDADDDEWQVGEPSSEFASAPVRQAPTMMDETEPAARPAPAPVRRLGSPIQAQAPRFAPRPQAKPSGFQLGQTISDAGEATSPGTTHASGFFLALFFFVAIGFFGASAMISDEPAASTRILSQLPGIGEYFARPIVPAMLVALHDVHSQYYQLKGGHVALVISGKAQNVGARPLHLIEIDANLVGDGARPLASQTVYCGNELSAKMLGEMTPREIEFSQGLSPQRTFLLNPSASAPFLMVFVDPPTGAGKLRISVTKAGSVSVPLDSSAPSIPPA